MDLFPVDSTMLASVGYDSKARLLVVLYNSGKAYEYLDVPQEVYQNLIKAESIGHFMHDHILNQYDYRPFRGWRKPESEAQNA